MTTPLIISQDDLEAGGKEYEYTNDEGIQGTFTYNNNIHSANINIRMGFLKKVYGLLSIQLLITTGVGAIFMEFAEPVREFLQKNSWIFHATVITTFVILIALHFKRKEHPINLILLTTFTLCESFMIGICVSLFDALIVIEAFFITLLIILSLTFYTFQSKRDFSSMGAGLFATLSVFLIAGFIQIFVQLPIFDFIIGIGGTLLFSLYIIYDTHMLMHHHSPEEYILVTIHIYLDVINLFLSVLRVLAAAKK